MITKIRFKEIKLYPTRWKLHAFYIDEKYNSNEYSKGTRMDLSIILNKKYGADQEYYFENAETINTVQVLESTKNSEMKGERIIVMIINPELKILVHELIHVLYELSNYSAIETNYKSQEWIACFNEYLFEETRYFNDIPFLTKVE